MIRTIYWLIKSLREIENTDKYEGKTYVFTTLRYLSFPIHQEMFMANVLARGGAKVVILIDNGIYEHWDSYQVADQKKELNPYRNRFRNFKSFKHFLVCKFFLFFYCKHSNIKVVKLKSILDQEDLSKIEITQNEINNAISSVRRYFGCGYYDEKIKSHKAYYNASIINCEVSVGISNYILNSIKPNKVITSHGIYSLWGPIYDNVSKEIPVIIYGAHIYKDDETFLTDTVAQTLSKDSTWKKFKNDNAKLSDKKKEKVDQYFQKRINHKTKDTNAYYGSVKKFEQVIVNKKSDDIKNIGIFPNIIWDGDIVQRDKYFNGVIDWLIQTVKYAEESKNNFIVRFHPAEATLHTKGLKLKDILIDLYPDVLKKDNIIFINSETKIDTYAFIKDNIDLGIVYDGILTMELTYMNIPVLSPSISRFSYGNFVINPNNKDEYFNFLSDYTLVENHFHKRDEIDSEFMMYAYWYLFEAGYFMPIYDRKRFGKVVYDSNTIELLKSNRFRRFEEQFFSLLSGNG